MFVVSFYFILNEQIFWIFIRRNLLQADEF